MSLPEYYGNSYQQQYSKDFRQPDLEDEVPLLQSEKNFDGIDHEKVPVFRKKAFTLTAAVTVVVLLLVGIFSVRHIAATDSVADPLFLQGSKSLPPKTVYPCRKDCKDPCGSYVVSSYFLLLLAALQSARRMGNPSVANGPKVPSIAAHAPKPLIVMVIACVQQVILTITSSLNTRNK